MKGLAKKSPPELLALYAQILNALRDQGIVRSTNNPAGDFAEHLCVKAFKWSLAQKSTKGYDAEDNQGVRYEIKSRRLTPSNTTRRLSGIRDIKKKHFDYLVGILFEEDFSIFRACLIPHSIVKTHSTFHGHTQAWIFILDDFVWDLPGVKDITMAITRAYAKLA